jgi:CubicO group peptidase (beta-lactamase class C family)
VDEGITPALVVLVARRGIIVLHEAFGRFTPDTDSPPLPRDAIFPLASISKPITATAAMLLVEEGLLGLNRPVCEYLPEFVGEGKQMVMVHHLLTHTSGLRAEDLVAHAVSKGAVPLLPLDHDPPRLADYLRAGYDAPLWKPPGVEMSYCTYNYELLGQIVARVSGQSLEELVCQRITHPLGMADTHFLLPEAVRHRVVRRPADALFAEFLQSIEEQEEPYGSAGAFSTVLDMAIFGQMFLNRGSYGDVRVLSVATVAEMTRNQIPGISARFAEEYFPEAMWAYGWNIHGDKKAVRDGSLRSARAFSHEGAGGVLLWVDPIYDLVGVFFSVAVRSLLPTFNMPDWSADLFMNMATAAVVDM